MKFLALLSNQSQFRALLREFEALLSQFQALFSEISSFIKGIVQFICLVLTSPKKINRCVFCTVET